MASFALTNPKFKTITTLVSQVAAAENVSIGPVTSDGYQVDPTDSLKLATIGIAMGDADSGDPIIYARDGDVIEVGNTLTPHRTLVAQLGGNVDYEDQLNIGDTHLIIGFTRSASEIEIAIHTGTEKTV